MKISTKQARNFRPTIRKVVTALALASVMGGISISSALGQHNDIRVTAAQDRNQNANRNRNDRRDQRAYRPAYQHPYRYSQPVYAPPPVYYYPEQQSGISLQSHGISLFFPLDLR